MITFRQFMEDEKKVPDLEDFLVDHCHDLISELDADLDELEDLPLWRGMTPGGAKPIMLMVHGKARRCYIKDVRMNRAPLDTHPDISDVMNDVFEHTFGWKPRSQSVFAYGKHGRHLIDDFGDPYRIYPMGKFKFLWGNVTDLTHKIAALMKQYNIPNKDVGDAYTNSEQLADMYEMLSDNLVPLYHDTDLHSAITGAPREIMIGCKQYLAVPA